jgi:hypothetical protein
MQVFTHGQRNRIAIIVALCAVIGIAAGLEVMHLHGLYRYDHTMANLRAAGEPTTMEDLRSLAPKTNSELQARYERWVTSMAGFQLPDEWAREDHLQETDEWLMGERQDLPVFISDIVKIGSVNMNKMHGILGYSGGIDAFSGQNIQPIDWSQPVYVMNNGLVSPLESLTIEGLSDHIRVLNQTANWLRWQSMSLDNPIAALIDLDHLVEATGHPERLTDAIISMYIADLRDRAYFESACRGHLGAADADRWLSEDIDYFRLMADGWRGERVIFAASLADHLRAHPSDIAWRYYDRSPSLIDSVEVSLSQSMEWLYGMDDCTTLSNIMYGVEQRMRRVQSSMEYVHEASLPMYGLSKRAIPNVNEVPQTVLMTDTRRRMYRIAVRCLKIARENSSLIDDEPAMRAHLGTSVDWDAHDRQLGLRYERIGDHRFRITVDPEVQAPDFADRSRIAYFGRLGRPAKVVTPKIGTPYTPMLVTDQYNIEVTVRSPSDSAPRPADASP